MNKYLLAYPVWLKVDMVKWLMEGIAENFDPDRADVLFMFSNCDDGSQEEFEKNREILKAFGVDFFDYWGDDPGEPENHNILLKRFAERLDCDALIVPQDDNRFLSGTLLTDLDRLWDRYGERLGLIGGRDGFNFGYQNMVGSPHSRSELKKKTLKIGEWEEKTLLNTGPFVYFRHVAKKAGLNDQENRIYGMLDYCLKCHHDHDLKNIVMGMDIEHRTFGRLRAPTYKRGIEAVGNIRLHEKWTPILGRNVI